MSKQTKLYPYIKPTTRINERGYRMFEVGYCWQEDGGKFHNRVIGSRASHIWVRGFGFLGDLPFDSISVDLTREGFIRFFTFDEGSSKGCSLRWNDEIGLPLMILKLVKNEEESNAKNQGNAKTQG